MDLLSPQETHAFQAFLSAMDYADLSPTEWALLNGPNPPDDDGIFPHSQQRPSSEALAKATKDLMSLGAGRWESFSQQLQDSRPNQQLLSRNQQHPTTNDSYGPNNHRHGSRCETFPFLNPKSHLLQQQSALSLPPDFRSQIASSVAAAAASSSETSASTSTTTTPASPHSPFRFSDHAAAAASSSSSSSHIQLPQARLHQSLSRQRRASSPPASKRSSVINSAKRRKPPLSTATSAVSSSSSSSTPPKQLLLSPSQKKANHIQSEQKRRANIRRGYEALCDTVPALREAIREEEEAEVRMSRVEGGGLAGGGGKPSRSKRKRKDAIGSGEGDKTDGRAGPRSENVVLSKTIDYIHDLVNERTALLARLERARTSLSAGHPALESTCVPLWEREWKGGEGKLNGEGMDEGDEDNDDGCDSS